MEKGRKKAGKNSGWAPREARRPAVLLMRPFLSFFHVFAYLCLTKIVIFCEHVITRAGDDEIG